MDDEEEEENEDQKRLRLASNQTLLSIEFFHTLPLELDLCRVVGVSVNYVRSNLFLEGLKRN